MFATARPNLLLASLSRDAFERWSPYMLQVELPVGRVLFEPGASMAYAYFPQTALVSLLSVMSRGLSTEIAVVGHDGVVGVSLFMGGGPAMGRAVVHGAGSAVRIPAAARLQRDGVIRCSRGRIRVVDRPGLEARACECYAAVKREYQRLFPGFPARPPGVDALHGGAA